MAGKGKERYHKRHFWYGGLGHGTPSPPPPPPVAGPAFAYTVWLDPPTITAGTVFVGSGLPPARPPVPFAATYTIAFMQPPPPAATVGGNALTFHAAQLAGIVGMPLVVAPQPPPNEGSAVIMQKVPQAPPPGGPIGQYTVYLPPLAPEWEE